MIATSSLSAFISRSLFMPHIADDSHTTLYSGAYLLPSPYSILRKDSAPASTAKMTGFEDPEVVDGLRTLASWLSLTVFFASCPPVAIQIYLPSPLRRALQRAISAFLETASITIPLTSAGKPWRYAGLNG